jgi:hypothetical protein
MMVVEFEEALRIAKECVGKRTGDSGPTVLRYELRDNYFFQFRTLKGDIDIIVDPRGEVGHCFEEQPSDEPPEPMLKQQDAVEKALCFLGDGKVERIKAKDGGYEVEVYRDERGTEVLFVDSEGMVHRQKCSVLTKNLALDIN